MVSTIHTIPFFNSFWFLDESPNDDNHEAFGHTKGNIAFDSKAGFWLVHSTPRWPNPSSGTYNYPDKEKTYGQSFLCMSLSTTYMDTVGAQLLVNKPYIYDSNLPSSISSKVPNMQAALNGNWVSGATNQSQSLQTVGGQKFISFAKNSDWDSYLYENFVEPYYGSGMLVESWMNGADSNKMPTFCTPQYDYDSINVRAIQLTSSISWDETKDHSKWTISVDRKGYICIGDINRQFSQSKRGGGTVSYYYYLFIYDYMESL
jgi:deoxyribonuclease-2